MESKLSAFFEKYDLPPKLETSRSYIFDCPVCNGKRKLYIQKSDGRTVCFKQKSEECPKAGSKPNYVLHLLSGVPQEKIKDFFNSDFNELLGEDISVNFSDEKKIQTVKEEVELASLPDDYLYIDDSKAKDGLEYLLNRGLELNQLINETVLYSPAMRRVIFPVIMDNLLIGWQGRAIDLIEKNYRMYNLPGTWKNKSIMFYDNIKSSKHVIIAEGAVSALKFKNVGGYVATMGKNISKKQLELIVCTNVKKIYFALDRDALDKIHFLRNTILTMKHDIECYIVNVPSNRDDFGDCTYEECESAFKNAEIINGDEIYVCL